MSYTRQLPDNSEYLANNARYSFSTSENCGLYNSVQYEAVVLRRIAVLSGVFSDHTKALHDLFLLIVSVLLPTGLSQEIFIDHTEQSVFSFLIFR